jgi:hypothetical protein
VLDGPYGHFLPFVPCPPNGLLVLFAVGCKRADRAQTI